MQNNNRNKRPHIMSDYQYTPEYNKHFKPDFSNQHSNQGNHASDSNRKSRNFQEQRQKFYDYFLVMNFETVKLANVEEIVEVVLLKVDSKSFTSDLFHEYVKPVNQLDATAKLPKPLDQMANMPSFAEVIQNLDRWLIEHNCGDNSMFVTWGSFHLGRLLPEQLRISKSSPIEYYNEWVDLKKTCAEFMEANMRELRVNSVAADFGIPPGESTCKGMTKTLADILEFMMIQGFPIQSNSSNSSNKKQRNRSVERPKLPPKDQLFDYFLVLDFEATCIKDEQIDPQEIIEFPTVVVNAKTFEKDGQFHEYVKPLEHPKLSRFCTELTSIKQETVDKADTFEHVMNKFSKWMEERFLRDNKKVAFVTCGDWDLKTMIGFQCRVSRMQVPPYFKSWINIKNIFEEAAKDKRAGGMMAMINKLGLKHEGHHHSGIDDCKNIANILIELMRNYGAQPDITFVNRRPDYIPPQRQANFQQESTNANSTGRKPPGLAIKINQNFKYFLVLDFEATCIKGPDRIDPQEIIEFPVLKVNANSLKIEAEFHEYVRPIEKPQLTEFCKNFTGIEQQTVNEANDFISVLNKFDNWMKEQGFLDKGASFAFVTMGDWDLQTMIARQCAVSQISVPQYFNSWINLKKLYMWATKRDKCPDQLTEMMETMGLHFEGRLHSGIDDCRNIAKILTTLIGERGCLAKITFTIKERHQNIQRAAKPPSSDKKVEQKPTEDVPVPPNWENLDQENETKTKEPSVPDTPPLKTSAPPPDVVKDSLKEETKRNEPSFPDSPIEKDPASMVDSEKESQHDEEESTDPPSLSVQNENSVPTGDQPTTSNKAKRSKNKKNKKKMANNKFGFDLEEFDPADITSIYAKTDSKTVDNSKSQNDSPKKNKKKNKK